MTLNQLMIFILPVALAGLVWHQHRLNRVALKAAWVYCQKHGLQFLDQSVALRGLRIVRNQQKLWVLERSFHFEFTLKGSHRYKGWVTMQAAKVIRIHSEPVHEQNIDSLH